MTPGRLFSIKARFGGPFSFWGAMIFYLYRWDGRLMIDSADRIAICDGAREAPSWIDAKRQFGFELTPLQAEMLKARSS